MLVEVVVELWEVQVLVEVVVELGEVQVLEEVEKVQVF